MVSRISGFAVTTPDTDRLSRFWKAAFGCCELSRTTVRPDRPGTTQLSLGNASIEILEFFEPGRPYPAHLCAFDNEFQHFAIVVSDMAQAYARLCSVAGWTAITRSGPQRLPDSSGGVTAFKFQDPDGHPLELLSFPPATIPLAWQSGSDHSNFLGIDHSALSVADADRSIAFYESLGLCVAARSFNHGDKQALLDAVVDPQIDVIALTPIKPTPHVELLFYRNATARRKLDIQNNDVFASRLIFERGLHDIRLLESEVLQDPDGHRLEIRPEKTARGVQP